MTEQHARTIAPILGGCPWQPYPGLWLVLIHRDDGSFVIIDRDAICAYDNVDAIEDSAPRFEIRLD